MGGGGNRTCVYVYCDVSGEEVRAKLCAEARVTVPVLGGRENVVRGNDPVWA